MSSPPSMKSRARCLTLVVACALVGDAHGVLAQSRLCAPIRPGETVTEVARRITGDARNRREPWFQVVDPATSGVISKATYDYVRAGWNACVATGATRATAPRVSRTSIWALRGRAVYDDVARVMQADDSNLALSVVLLAFIALATHGADQYLRGRQRILDAMRQFSLTFVQEFERPLVVPDASVRPIRSRLRFAPHSARLDILIAPGTGHRYPNLADHQRNVEYDLQRVLHILRDQPFVNGRPYMDGAWVVLPFQLKPAISQAGAT